MMGLPAVTIGRVTATINAITRIMADLLIVYISFSLSFSASRTTIYQRILLEFETNVFLLDSFELIICRSSPQRGRPFIIRR